MLNETPVAKSMQGSHLRGHLRGYCAEVSLERRDAAAAAAATTGDLQRGHR